MSSPCQKSDYITVVFFFFLLLGHDMMSQPHQLQQLSIKLNGRVFLTANYMVQVGPSKSVFIRID